MVVNKRLVEDDENVLARKVFVTLVKLYPRGYSILNDGNFVKKIYAASDDEAIRQFNELATKGQLLTESVKKAVKEQIVEAKHETLVESVMSDLDLEVKEAGGKEAWIANVDEQIDDLSHYLNYLKKSAYNEVNRGGNFESTDEVDEAIRNCEKQLGLLKSKKQIIEERKDESVNEALYGMNQIEQFVKMADAIGLKTMSDFKDFMDREGQGKDVITALYDYLHDEIGDLDFHAKDESLKENLSTRKEMIDYISDWRDDPAADFYFSHLVNKFGLDLSNGYDGLTDDNLRMIVDKFKNLFRNDSYVSLKEDYLDVDSMTREELMDEIDNIYVWALKGKHTDITSIIEDPEVFNSTDADDEEGYFKGVPTDKLRGILKILRKMKNGGLLTKDDEKVLLSKNESLKEDLAVAVNGEEVPVEAIDTPVVEPVVVEVDAEKQPIEEIQEKISIEQVLSDLIKDEFEAIDGYSSSLATLKILENDGSDYSGIIANLEDIKNEELVHVGQLQKCLAEVNPKAEAIDDGKEEASETIAVAEEESAKGEEPVVEA